MRTAAPSSKRRGGSRARGIYRVNTERRLYPDLKIGVSRRECMLPVREFPREVDHERFRRRLEAPVRAPRLRHRRPRRALRREVQLQARTGPGAGRHSGRLDRQVLQSRDRAGRQPGARYGSGRRRRRRHLGRRRQVLRPDHQRGGGHPGQGRQADHPGRRSFHHLPRAQGLCRALPQAGRAPLRRPPGPLRGPLRRPAVARLPLRPHPGGRSGREPGPGRPSDRDSGAPRNWRPATACAGWR